eukprot:TRINITY_DN5723_c0_g1_i1.p1 TRINITY_DN5723_c0_g1~~TRINITY_DN5723_c0_g1_i1.p1  ORF type:complete len:195 (+),score=13.44 TRINITY_DN5723_c0_g1_i1:390-974(+)
MMQGMTDGTFSTQSVTILTRQPTEMQRIIFAIALVLAVTLAACSTSCNVAYTVEYSSATINFTLTPRNVPGCSCQTGMGVGQYIATFQSKSVTLAMSGDTLMVNAPHPSWVGLTCTVTSQAPPPLSEIPCSSAQVAASGAARQAQYSVFLQASLELLALLCGQFMLLILGQHFSFAHHFHARCCTSLNFPPVSS